MPLHERAPWVCTIRVIRSVGWREAPDVSIAQPVEDHDDKLAGHRHPGDVLGPPFCDAVVVRLEFRSAPAVGDRLYGRPADQFRAGLGDTPSADLGIGLVMLGRQPRPRAQRLRVRKTGHVADLSHHDGRDGRTDTGDGLKSPIAGMSLS